MKYRESHYVTVLDMYGSMAAHFIDNHAPHERSELEMLLTPG